MTNRNIKKVNNILTSLAMLDKCVGKRITSIFSFLELIEIHFALCFSEVFYCIKYV